MTAARTTILLSLCALCFHATAQTFQPGYIVKNDGTKIYGFIQLKEARQVDKICVFKTNADAAPVEYTTNDLSEYVFRDYKQYRRVQKRQTPGKTEPTFMECILSGSASLYIWDSDFYAAKTDGEAYLLTEKESVVETKNGMRSITKREYALILKERIFNDCADQSLLYKLSTGSFSKKNLLELFRQYNRCVNSPTTLRTDSIAKRKIDWGLTAGVQSANVGFGAKDAVTVDMVYGRFPFKTNFQVGVRMRMVFPRAALKRALNIEALYQPGSFQGVYTTRPSAGVEFSTTNDIQLDYLKLPFLFQQSLGLKKIAPHFGFGVSPNILLRSNHTKTGYFSDNGLFVPNAPLAFDPPKFLQLGLLVNFGLNIRTPFAIIPLDFRTELAPMNISTAGALFGSYKSANHLIFSLTSGILF
jgi:hypothetical protein